VRTYAHKPNIADSQTPQEYSLNDVRFTERIELALEGSKTSVLDWDIEHNHIYISPSWKIRETWLDC